MNSFKTTNYAGRTIYYGLGFIWLLWAALVALAGSWQLGLATALVFGFGLLDDLFGASSSKGFKGHLTALGRGTITTGLIKLIGISAVSFWYALQEGVTRIQGGGELAQSWYDPRRLAIACLAGAAIALTSNFFNLVDLRPGRAAKIYLFFATITAVVVVLATWFMGFNASELGLSTLQESLGYVGHPYLVTIIPIVLILIPDLREKAMLGDAGANAAGFVLGAFIVLWLGWVGIALYTLIMLALNLASEKVSFSHVIENNPLLKKLDNIGRLNSGE